MKKIGDFDEAAFKAGISKISRARFSAIDCSRNEAGGINRIKIPFTGRIAVYCRVYALPRNIGGCVARAQVSRGGGLLWAVGAARDAHDAALEAVTKVARFL